MKTVIKFFDWLFHAWSGGYWLGVVMGILAAVSSSYLVESDDEVIIGGIIGADSNTITIGREPLFSGDVDTLLWNREGDYLGSPIYDSVGMGISD